MELGLVYLTTKRNGRKRPNCTLLNSISRISSVTVCMSVLPSCWPSSPLLTFHFHSLLHKPPPSTLDYLLILISCTVSPRSVQPNHHHRGLRSCLCVCCLGIHTFLNGPESFTSDARYLLGETPEISQLFVATGMNSSGIASSGGVGKAAAEWVSGGGVV